MEWLLQWLGPIGNFISNYGEIVILLIIGLAVEKYYVGRVTTFTNSWAIFFYFIKNVSPIHLILDAYILFGLALGILGIVAYYDDRSLYQSYYDASWLYSSITAFLIIVFGAPLNGFLWNILP